MSPRCPIAPDAAASVSVALEDMSISTVLIRFHSHSREAASFNPNITRGEPSRMERAEDGSRFNPFPGYPHPNIPTLYAGSTEHSAALESVFHDIAHEPDPTYPSASLDSYVMSTLSLTRPLKVLRLVNSQLRQVPVSGRSLSLTEDEIVHAPPLEYPVTRGWARYFHRNLPDLAGLAWRPRLGGEGLAYVLFGDRVASSDFETPSKPLPLNSGKGRTMIETIAALAHITIIDTTTA